MVYLRNGSVLRLNEGSLFNLFQMVGIVIETFALFHHSVFHYMCFAGMLHG